LLRDAFCERMTSIAAIYLHTLCTTQSLMNKHNIVTFVVYVSHYIRVFAETNMY